MFVQLDPEGWREILPQNRIAAVSFSGFKAFFCDMKDRGYKSLGRKRVMKLCVTDEHRNPQVRQPPSSLSITFLYHF